MKARAMHPGDGDPDAKSEAGVDVAADRRRAGRPGVVNPQLLPLLRGQFDPEALVDPQVGQPAQFSVDRELVSGGMIAFALLLVGGALRFVV